MGALSFKFRLNIVFMFLGLFFFFGLFLSSPKLMAGAWNELSASEQQSLMNGSQIYKEQNIGGAWPKMFAYHYIAAAPVEVAAIGFDYEQKPKYTSGLRSAKITKIYSPLNVEVSYYVELPIIGGENFTLYQELKGWNNNTTFSTNWKLVRADKTRQSDGYATIEALGSGTIFSTISYVDPGIPGASLARGMATEQFKGAAASFARQVIAIKQNYPDFMKSEVDRLLKALK